MTQRRQLAGRGYHGSDQSIGLSPSRSRHGKARVEQLSRNRKIDEVMQSSLAEGRHSWRSGLYLSLCGDSQRLRHLGYGEKNFLLLDVLEHPIEDQVVGMQKKIRRHEELSAALVPVAIRQIIDVEPLAGRHGLDIEAVLRQLLPLRFGEIQVRSTDPLGNFGQADRRLVHGRETQSSYVFSLNEAVAIPLAWVFEAGFDPT